MKGMSIIGAAVGGVVGALLWAAVTYFSHLEVGWIAWAVGGLVGFLSMVAGGSGTSNGVLCAIVALLSIFGGKCLAEKLLVGPVIEKAARELHAELLKDAGDLALLKPEADLKAFMVSHKYASHPRKGDISEEELAWFKESRVPMLQQLEEEKPSFEDWLASDDGEEMVGEMKANVKILDGVLKDLNPIDLIFAILGIGTAFKVGSGAGRKKEDSSPAAA